MAHVGHYLHMKEEEPVSPPTRAECWTATTWMMMAMIMNCYTLNFTHWRMPDPRTNLPLRDVGFDLIPILRLQWITDSMLGYFNVTVVALYLYAYHVEKDPAKSRHMWIKYFMVWGCCMMMRAFSIVLTSLPATENHCQNPRSIESLWTNTIVGFLTFGGKNVHCGDLLFSGHTINIIVAVSFIVQYGAKFRVLVACSVVCSVICLFLIIASRSHYTIDVYIATCISFLTYKSTADTVPPFLSPIVYIYEKVVPPAPLTHPNRAARMNRRKVSSSPEANAMDHACRVGSWSEDIL